MDKNKKAILKLYDMIRECRDKIEYLETEGDYLSDDTMTRCKELKELGFSKEEVKEILGIDSEIVATIVNSIFEEYE